MSTAPTSTSALIATVENLYVAFGRGEIPTILAALRPDVDWHVNVDISAPGAATIPPFVPRRGPAEVGAFFAALVSELEFHGFEPVSFLGGDREVAVRVNLDATVRSTGIRQRFEAVHWWTFDEAGKVARFVDFFDTLGEAAAWGRVQAVG